MIVAVTNIFQDKTIVPKDVREALKVDDGDRLVWDIADGKVSVKNAREKEVALKPKFTFISRPKPGEAQPAAEKDKPSEQK